MSANSLTGRSGVTPECTERDPKPTPGPWRVEPVFIAQVTGGALHFGEYQFPFESINGVSRTYPREEAEANARLMAAAPDLLEALEALDANWRIGGYGGPDDPRVKARFTDETRRIWAMACAAIAKAKLAAPSTPSTGGTQEANK